MITLTPAYGRDYKSSQAAIKDYLAGKDLSSTIQPHPTTANTAPAATSPTSKSKSDTTNSNA